MKKPKPSPARAGIFLGPAEGHPYGMGRISAFFKADGVETSRRYSISEWWLDPHTQGPGPHSHEEDDVFFVLEGTMRFLLGDFEKSMPEIAAYFAEHPPGNA